MALRQKRTGPPRGVELERTERPGVAGLRGILARGVSTTREELVVAFARSYLPTRPGRRIAHDRTVVRRRGVVDHG